MFRKDAPYDSISLIYKMFRENDKKNFGLTIFLLSRYVEEVFFSMLLTLKNYVWAFLKQVVSNPLRKRKMLSRLLEDYPTQWLKVTISGHPLKIQVTLIPLGNCHIRFLKKIIKMKKKPNWAKQRLHALLALKLQQLPQVVKKPLRQVLKGS